MELLRTTATQIMTRAQAAQGRCLLGLIDVNESVHYCDDPQQLAPLLERYPAAALLYNQHPDVIAFIESLPLADRQYSIEIFQDTEGVFGLRCYQRQGKMQTPVEMHFREPG